ncbi:MAG: penicillin-binding transpeptidase domain-containing protein, partial [Actinomycetota bacterium]
WDPSNYSDSGSGTLDLFGATRSSVNTIFAQLVVEVGPENVADIAHRMGIRSPLETPEGAVPCSITLGTLEVTPLEMAEAYATWAALGVRHQATPVHQIRGPNRDLVERTDRRGRQVMEENEALQAIYAMRQVVCCGTASGAVSLSSETYFGKTGTTDDDSDVWFCGASSEVSTCVWVGHPNGRVPMPGATGGEVAAPIWNAFMASIHGETEPEPFEEPDFTGDVIKPSPVPAPSPSPTEEKEEKEEEPKEEEEPSQEPSPSPPPSPPPTTPPPTTPPPSSPPPTTPPPRGDGGGGADP